MAEPTYYLRVNGKVMGPLSIDKLQSLQERGRLLSEHELSTDRRQWRRASEVLEFFGEEPAAGPSIAVEPEVPSANQNQWYYACDGERIGPVPFAHLQQLVRRGKLQRDHLVWNPEFQDWQPVQFVPGLYERENPIRPKGKSSADNHEIVSLGTMNSLLSFLRRTITAADLEAICRFMIRLGGCAMLLAMISATGFLMLHGSESKDSTWIILGILAAPMMWVLKYGGHSLCAAMHCLVQTSPHRMSSRAYLDLSAAACFLLAFLTIVVSIWYAIWDQQGIERLYVLVMAAQFDIMFIYLGCTALHPEWLNIQLDRDVRAGEEGISIIAFHLKLLLRLAPIQFGVWSVLGALGLTLADMFYLIGDDWVNSAVSVGVISGLVVLGAAVFPLLYYEVMVFSSIWLDLGHSVLSIPRQLEGLADDRRAAE